MNWNNKKVLVTGGASFIGSHLCEQIVQKGAKVRVAENFSSGARDHLAHIECETLEGDLLDPSFCDQATKGMEVVFHLAADHGGRGYIDSHPVECSTNMILDGQVFRHAHRNEAEKIIFKNKQIRKKLELYIFKIVRKKRSDFIKQEKEKKTRLIFIDIPLLFENNLEKQFHKVISIIASKQVRLKRLKKTRKMTETQFKNIIKSQTSDVIRKNKSDYVIYNNSTLKDYKTKINKLINKL